MVEFSSRYGPVALVTGAAGGIGAGFARELSARGLDLALTDINLPGLEATAASIRESSGARRSTTLGLDMTDRSAVPALDAATADLDVGFVICNHLRGFGHGRFLDGDLEQCHDQLEANVRAYVDLAHCFGRRLREPGPRRHHLPLVADRHPGLAVRGDVRGVEGVRAGVRFRTRLRTAEHRRRRAHARAELGEHRDLPAGGAGAVARVPHDGGERLRRARRWVRSARDGSSFPAAGMHSPPTCSDVCFPGAPRRR